MLWIIVSAGGEGLTSGNVEFPTKEACEAARMEFGRLTLDTKPNGIPVGAGAGSPRIICIQKATGKP